MSTDKNSNQGRMWILGVVLLLCSVWFAYFVGGNALTPILEHRRAEALVSAYGTLAQVGATLERYRVETGTYPKDLTHLVPEFWEQVPLDPYGKKPLMYMQKPKGPRLLYSIGPDQKDSGGTPYDPRSKSGDLVYWVEK